MKIVDLLDKLIVKTELKELKWHASNTIGRYELDLKNETVALDSNFSAYYENGNIDKKNLIYRLLIIDKNANVKSYNFNIYNEYFSRIENLYKKVNEFYNDNFLKNIIEEM
ncbi:MAG: hypothetical protein EHM58_09620 [Ignavibacteriae bacterium]|nr:MAG: hypothetical protein EHM58_09620 [Ignavibacteriota bacterium]